MAALGWLRWDGCAGMAALGRVVLGLVVLGWVVLGLAVPGLAVLGWAGPRRNATNARGTGTGTGTGTGRVRAPIANMISGVTVAGPGR